MTNQAAQLIIVTGRPAGGKSTLARLLAKELSLPVISKDRVREVLFDQLGWSDRPWAQLLGRASIDLMFHLAEVQLEAGRSLILDNSFDPALSSVRFQALKSKFDPVIIQIICYANWEIRFQRFEARAQTGERHPGHGDAAVVHEWRTQLRQGDQPAQEIPVLDVVSTVITVDTNNFAWVDTASILAQVRAGR